MGFCLTSKIKSLLVVGLCVCLLSSLFASTMGMDVAASVLTLEIGSDLQGAVEDLAVDNSNIVNASELVGVPDCLILRVDYLGVPSTFFNLSVAAYGYYDGNPSHDMSFQVYNSSVGWQTMNVFEDESSYMWYNATYSDALGLNELVSDGNVSVRFIHEASGVAGHILHLDTLLLSVDEGVNVTYSIASDGALLVNDSFVGNGTVVYASNSALNLVAYPDANFTFNGFVVDGVDYLGNPLLISDLVGNVSVSVAFASLIPDTILSVDDAVGLAVVALLFAIVLPVAFLFLRKR